MLENITTTDLSILLSYLKTHIEDAIKHHPNYPQEIIAGGAQVTDSVIVGNIKDLIYDR